MVDPLRADAPPVLVALDRPDLHAALTLARAVAPSVLGFKVGLELFAAAGPAALRAVAALGLPVFLDLKLHDIPNTVAGTLRALAGQGAAWLSLHAAGGKAMLAAAVAALPDGPARPKLLAITLLTSLDRADLDAQGIAGTPPDQVLRLARLALAAGIDGLVCSPQEVGMLRAALGPKPLLVTPGIIAPGQGQADQKRTADPATAIAAGADLLVVGRAITAAADPGAAAAAIAAGLRA